MEWRPAWGKDIARSVYGVALDHESLPENLHLPDGMGTWTGGWLGRGKQIEDFNDVHDQWYMRNLPQRNR